ncbi:MAG: hypothetical protein EBU90_08395 [Proteobacteria bacterium]|nr:hypothetical protein [Pseudomonadota bacterium]
MNPYTIWFILFAFAAYFIVTDESVAKAFYFITKIVRNKFEVFKWWLIHNPQTPWARYSMWRRSNRLAKELMKELESKNK